MRRIQSENQILKEKILNDENIIKSLQSNYQNAVDDFEESYKVNTNLEMKVQQLSDIIGKIDVRKKISKLQKLVARRFVNCKVKSKLSQDKIRI